jgi:hypothetical protein
MNTKFVNADTILFNNEYSDADIEKFIRIANANLVKGKDSVNSGLNGVPVLTDYELQEVNLRAKDAGWRIEVIDDNYSTTTYRFHKL